MSVFRFSIEKNERRGQGERYPLMILIKGQYKVLCVRLFSYLNIRVCSTKKKQTVFRSVGIYDNT